MSDNRQAQNYIKIRLSTKLIINNILLASLLMTAMILIVEKQMRKSIMDEFAKHGLFVTMNLAAINSNYVTTYDYVNIEQNVDRVAKENGLLYTAVLFFDGEVAAYSGQEESKEIFLNGVLYEQRLGISAPLIQYGELDGKQFCDIAVPILLKGKNWGTVRAGFSLKDIHTNVLKTRQLLLSVGGIVLFCGCMASLFVARRITRPIGNLVKSVEAITNGDHDHPIRVSTHDEIGYLGHRFTAMQSTVKKHIGLLTKTNCELTTANEKLRREIAERIQVEKALRRRDAILEALGFAAERFLKDRFWEQSIQQVLERVGKATGVSRLYIVHGTPFMDGKEFTNPCYEWFASGTTLQQENSEVHQLSWHSAETDQFEEPLSEIRYRFDPSTESPTTLQPAAAHQHGNRSIGVPICFGEIQWGILGFEESEQKTDYSVVELDVIKTVADNLGAAIQRRQTIDMLEAANRAKVDFLANMSHELRTPLNHIIGFTELLVEKNVGDLNVTQEEYLKDALQSGKNLLSLINNILDLSKVDTGKMELLLSEVNLRLLMENSLIKVKEKAMKHNIRLRLNVEEMPSFITADKRKLKQILCNLLANAVKFTPDGGKVTVTARMVDRIVRSGLRKGDRIDQKFIVNPFATQIEPSNRNHTKCVEISVSDTGIGITSEDLERIFNHFYQVDNSKSRKYEGTGLGLSLVKKFVELHGGRIRAESEGIGKGSTFRFVLPA